MSCKAYRIEIEELERGGELGRGARAHVEACGACRHFFRERAALRSLVADIGKVSAPADFEFRLRARMRENGGAGRGGFVRRLLTPAAATALTACLAVALTALVYFRQPSQTSEQARRQTQTATSPAGETPSAARSTASKEDDDGEADSKRESDVQLVKADAGTVKDVTAKNASSRGAKSEVSPRKGGGVGKADFASRGAGVVTRSGADSLDVARLDAPIPVQVPSSKQSMRVVLRDENGASRTVSMRPVSFGAQELVGRGGSVARTSHKAAEGVW